MDGCARFTAFLILCFFIGIGQAGAVTSPMPGKSFYYYPNDIAKATGTVVAIGRNAIEIYDEEEKRVRRFVYLGQEQYHQGEYIRIYYHPEGAIVVTIKRMTVYKYNEKGQNLGYFSHQPTTR